MNKRTLIVGNWKMNMNISQASLLLHRLHERIKISRDVEVVLAPNMLALQPLSMQIDRRKFRLAAQNAYQKDDGPFTGEVSFTMLRDLVHYAIIGHSDRRHKFGEDMPTIREKVAAAVRNEITPILCVGETESEHRLGEGKHVIQDQVLSALRNLTSGDVQNIVIAYEPVWAISKGTDYMHHITPTPDDVIKAVKVIRRNIAHLYSEKAANNVRVLYGGSINASNAAAFLGIDGIDGLLVGGASLNYHEFAGITEAAMTQARQKEDTNANKK